MNETRQDWAAFYRELYSKNISVPTATGTEQVPIGLGRYLPSVLYELECGPVREITEPYSYSAGATVLRAAASDAADATNRLYEDWTRLDSFASFCESQYNPWSEESSA